MKKFFLGTVILSSVTFVACNREEEITSTPEPEQRKIEFKGQPDPKFAGVWKQKSADIRYTLKPDGSFTYKGTVTSPGGVHKLDSTGTWGVEGDRFYIKDNKNEIFEYVHKLDGDKLEFTSLGMRKLTTTYEKEK